MRDVKTIEQFMEFCAQDEYSIVQSDKPCQIIRLHDSKRMIKRKIERFLRYKGKGGLIRPHIQIGKDESLSVQANFFTYCYPKVNNADKYKQVEVGFPSFHFREKFERMYADSCDKIYPYTDVEALYKEIHFYIKHKT